MTELNDFYNNGFGWACRQCERELAVENNARHSRLLREGESEGKVPRLSSPALARWTDKTRQVLMCPRCGITERVDKQ